MTFFPFFVATDRSALYFKSTCRTNNPNFLAPCKSVRYIDIYVDVQEAVRTVAFALERLGYDVGREW